MYTSSIRFILKSINNRKSNKADILINLIGLFNLKLSHDEIILNENLYLISRFKYFFLDFLVSLDQI